MEIAITTSRQGNACSIRITPSYRVFRTVIVEGWNGRSADDALSLAIAIAEAVRKKIEKLGIRRAIRQRYTVVETAIEVALQPGLKQPCRDRVLYHSEVKGADI